MKSASIFARLERPLLIKTEISVPKLAVLLFSFSFLVHCVFALIFINQSIALDDMFQYDMLARSLKNGNGFRWYAKADVEILRPYYSQFLDLDHLVFPEQGLPTTFRAPGYPFFLAFLYLFTPEASRLIPARLVQAALAALLAPLSAILALQVGFSRKVSAWSAFGISLYPILLFYPIGLASENLYVPLCLISILFIHRAARERGWRWILLAGLACGLTLLTRSIFAVAVILAGVWIGMKHPRGKKAGGVFLLVAFGLCLPWSARNSIIMRQPAFVENSAGYNLFIGYHPEGDGGFVSRIAILPMSILDDGERNRVCTQQALSFIRQNPIEALRRVGARLVKFLSPEDREFIFFYSNNFIGRIPQPWIVSIYAVLIIPWILTSLLGVLGLWQNRHHPLAQLAALFLLGYALPHFLIIAEPRFHLACVPILMPFSVCGWNALRNRPLQEIFKGSNLLVLFLFIVLACIFAYGLGTNFSRLISLFSEGGNQLYFSY